jgi:hypothetical protein
MTLFLVARGTVTSEAVPTLDSSALRTLFHDMTVGGALPSFEEARLKKDLDLEEVVDLDLEEAIEGARLLGLWYTTLRSSVSSSSTVVATFDFLAARLR